MNGERDLAFADTVVADDLEPPPSGVPIHDPEPPRSSRRRSCLPDEAGVVTRLSTAFDRVRYEVQASRVEMNRLWSETATVERLEVVEDDGIVQLRPPTFGRRLHLLLSFFEWDRDVLLRAAWIGLAVFVLAATLGAVFLL